MFETKLKFAKYLVVQNESSSTREETSLDEPAVVVHLATKGPKYL